MAWKYVMFEVRSTKAVVSYCVPVIFPDKLVHQLVDAVMVPCLREHFKGWHVAAVNAGKIESVLVDGLGGGSETLNLSHDPDDARLIEAYSYGHGIR